MFWPFWYGFEHYPFLYLYNENSLLDPVEGVAVDEVDLVVIEGQPGELHLNSG